MARFLPAQIKSWTNGTLLMTEENRQNSEHFYRGISTDTRTLRKGEIFLALKGENFDGHQFVETAIKKGAVALVLEEKAKPVVDLVQALDRGEKVPDLILVEDTLEAYGLIASGFRSTLLASVIAITGSVGKTTTRRMVSDVIAHQVRTHETVDNQNNLIGVPLTLLEGDDDDDVIVAELGMDRVGEIAKLSDISKPDIAILTSIGYSHAEYLGSRENILKEKTKIIEGMKSNGLVLINGQDDLLVKWVKSLDSEISVWAISNTNTTVRSVGIPGFWAEDIQVTARNTTFSAHNDLDPDTVVQVTIPAPGRYLVRAALFALASAYALGLDLQKAADACQNFHNTGNRQNIVKIGSNLIIDDSYNASLESMTSALESLDLLSNSEGRRLACLGGIRELGEYEEKIHNELGEYIVKHPVDILFLVGEEMAWTKEYLKRLSPDIETYHFASVTEVIPRLLLKLQENDSLLLKGSRFYELEKIHKALESRK